MVGSMGQPPTRQKGFWNKLKRGATFTTLGMVVLGGASLFLPFVPLVAAVAAGGIAGGAIASATGEDIKK